jgi:hypothetical protein
MYQLEDIFCPQLYPSACICLMMYFKNNWNAGPFSYFMDFLEEKKTYIFIYKKCEIKFKLCILCLLKIICLKMMSHAVNKKAFSNGSKSVEDEKKVF